MPNKPLEDKYIVLKYSDWNDLVDVSDRTNDRAFLFAPTTKGLRVISVSAAEELALQDVFVIRAQDVFGPAALFGYAHLIQSNLEINKLPGRPSPLSVEEIERLADLADTLTSVALDWQTRSKKIPD